jgi:uncharacterized membrane protein YfcA
MIRKKKDYSFLRMLALITQLGISMLTCIFLCMIAGKFLAERLHADWIFLVFLILGILAGFRSCYNFAFYKIDCFILNNRMCIIFWS